MRIVSLVPLWLVQGHVYQQEMSDKRTARSGHFFSARCLLCAVSLAVAALPTPSKSPTCESSSCEISKTQTCIYMSNAMSKVSDLAAHPPPPVADGLSSAVSQSVTFLPSVTLVGSLSARPCIPAVALLLLFSC